MSNNELNGPAFCPVCRTEYDGQEVAVVKQEGLIATLETKCLGCGKVYRFKASTDEPLENKKADGDHVHNKKL